MRKTYSYFEYLAATHYYSDVKLNLVLDQADSGFFLGKSEWDVGIKNPLDNLNFHTLWDKLPDDEKDFYRKMAKDAFYADTEIAFR